jgi:hypothetical protein
MDAKRRLPLFSPPGGGDDDFARPAWQWVGFGTLAIVVVWLPLAAIALSLAVRWTAASETGASPSAPLILAGLSAFGLAIAALAGGFLVGRWGPRGFAVRSGAAAGMAAALGAAVASWIAFGFMPAALLGVAIALPSGAAGASLGARTRS